MIRLAGAAFVTVALLAVARQSSAQQVVRLRVRYFDSVSVGAARLTTRHHDSLVSGTLVGAGHETLAIATSTDTVPVQARAVLRADVKGRRKRTVEGTIIGGGLGLAVGILLASRVVNQPTILGDFSDMERSMYVYGGSVAGALMGAVIGSRLSTDTWRRVSVAQLQSGFMSPTSR